MAEPTVVVVNPAAGGGRGGRAWPALATRLHAAGIPFTAALTERRGDGTALARQALHAGATTVVACGGDGTANEVVNGFFEDDRPVNPAARFGLIAAGTGNDLARVLGLEGDGALDALRPGGTTRRVDLLRVRFATRAGETSCRYALQGVFLGIVAEGAAVTLPPRIKRLGGSAGYLLGGALAVLRHRGQAITWRSDDGPAETARVNGGVIANAAFIGGGLEVAPGARLDDGLADFILVRDIGRLRLMALMPKLRAGTHLSHPAVSHHATRSVQIEANERMLLAIDGESVGYAPAEIAVCPLALPIALPPTPGYTG